jgi:hypothetical protein
VRRDHYRVAPGLYCTGKPGDTSPVLVTANYKLTFDSLRAKLEGVDAWILVVDTRGINVWCAAGKGTFSADEIVYQVKRTQLDKIVSHRQLILPQLSAPGVASHELKEGCGFRAVFGPILASNLPAFLQSGEATESMRTVTFTLRERAVLVPLELCLLAKPLLGMTLLFFLISGIAPTIYSLPAAIDRGLLILMATLVAVCAGAVVTPLLLPWLFFRQFWLKGVLAGVTTALAFGFLLKPPISSLEHVALGVWITGCASYLAMNFTGSTPFTSLSGVALEMRKGLVFQVGATVVSLGLWLIAPFC